METVLTLNEGNKEARLNDIYTLGSVLIDVTAHIVSEDGRHGLMPLQMLLYKFKVLECR